jgi:hypothetical protein
MAERFIWNLDTEYFVISNSGAVPNKIIVGDRVSETDLTHQDWLSSFKFNRSKWTTLTLTSTADSSDK